MRRPNVLVLITDQQRQPRHWPDQPGWLRALTPNDHELARTGLRFRNACCNTAMCSPSRATLLTGRYPAQHGVTLTLTGADLRPDPRNFPAVTATLARILASPGAPRGRALRGFARGMLQLPPRAGGEPVLPPRLPSLGHVLRAAGYEVAYKGKWHLTHPLAELEGRERRPGDLLGGWSQRDAELLRADYGLADWDPPDAGENAQAEHFGGGNAGEGEGWDEVYTRETERWLGRAELPEPFCLVVSLVNPHDVLGYPASYVAGGYAPSEFRELGVELPATLDEDLRDKPSVQTVMQMGLNAYLGPLRDRRERLDYVNFYAHLHRLVDEKIGRILAALGDPADPGSLRSRTVLVRLADHGEMGLSHGGLRQKMFNVYEETINVPLVVSNPVLFPEPVETDALASLIDVMPTLATLCGAQEGADGHRGTDLSPLLADAASPRRGSVRRSGVDWSAITRHPAPAPSVQDAIHFTYDDHQAATALGEVPGQPNRIRCVREADRKYAVYLDPRGRAAAEYEMYDLARDPDERWNLVDHRSGEARLRQHRAMRAELAERLEETVERLGTAVRG